MKLNGGYFMKNNYALAAFFAENTLKENIIPEIFKLFNIDCIKRCQLNPSVLDKLINEFNKNDVCDISILEKIITFIKSEQKEYQNKENELILKIRSYIDETFAEDISIECVAANLHISYYYMCHLFKNKFNMSIGTYRTQKRLEKAMMLLSSNDDKISNIASLCGYNSISYFTETFTKYIGVTPVAFKHQTENKHFHKFYDYNDMYLLTKTKSIKFISRNIREITQNIQTSHIFIPDNNFKFLHEAAIVEYKGVLYASWYNCKEKELFGYTPICGKRSFDCGKTWSDLEIICQDATGKILYCPPIYGICDDKLYMLVNQMVAPDHIHSLDLYILNTETDKFELLWSRPIPFKLNTNVVILPNGKLMLPGRIAELDGFPNTPAVLISDDGKIDSEWRMVKIAENGDLPDGTSYIHPELSVICSDDILYAFCRNDQRKVTPVYISKDFGETWSGIYSHDIPYISSKIYCGSLKDGRHYMICNVDKFDRSKLVLYITNDKHMSFSKKLVLSDSDKDNLYPVHYPAACEYDGYLYVIATKGYKNNSRGAELFKINLENI